MPDWSLWTFDFLSFFDTNNQSMIEFLLIFITCMVLAVATAAEYMYGLSSRAANGIANAASGISNAATNASMTVATAASTTTNAIGNLASNTFKGGKEQIIKHNKTLRKIHRKGN